jgi:error-prone DNA polymerase
MECGMSEDFLDSAFDEYGFYEWICHSYFSFLRSPSSPDHYVQKAHELGYRGLAITDYDGVYGLARAYRAWRSLKGTSLRLFYGTQIHFSEKKDYILYDATLVLLAQSHRGYSNICRLLSQKESKHDTVFDLKMLSRADLEDVVAILPMRGPRRCGMKEDLCMDHIRYLFPGRLYMALGRFLHPSEDMWMSSYHEIAQKYQIPILLSQDAFMHDRRQKDLHDIMQAIRLNRSIDEVSDHLLVNAERSFHGLPFLKRLYSPFPFARQALGNAHSLAMQIDFCFSSLRYRYPQEMIPEGMDSQQYLEMLVKKNVSTYYPQDIPSKIKDLLTKELELIRALGFADYFLTVWDIVRWARSQNILCQGRGSAANSAVCYILGITAINPECFDLLFERFLSMERGDPPDIDVDFEHERREEVIAYIYKRYGRHRAAMVANIISFQKKGALRAVGKALGLSEEILSQSSDLLTIRHRRKDIRSQVTDPLCPESLSARWSDLALRLLDVPRHMGIHSGGFIITGTSLYELCAVEPATMPGRTVIHWAKEDIEALGFFKIDILALGMLTAIRKCFDQLKQHEGRCYEMYSLPQDDALTYAMIQKADTVGVFQIESRAQMSMLPRLKPKCFYDLVIEVAIIRPGPIQGGLIHPYLRRRDGLDAVEYPHPLLKSILHKTLGVPLFQEQAMRIAMLVGDFTPGEADQLRRSMGSWQIKGDLGVWIEKLKVGMRAKGIPETFVEQLVGQLRGFAEYGFPESHAASFALLAYVSSYLRAHHPAAFCVALLNSQPMGFYSRHALIEDARRHGITIRPVCIQLSDYQAKLEPIENAGYAIRLGLDMVKGLQAQAAKDFVSRRQAYVDLAAFLKDQDFSRSDLVALAAADVFRCFGVDRRSAYWIVEAAGFSAFIEDTDLHQDFMAETALERVQYDFHSLSTSVHDHPCTLMKQHAWSYDIELGALTLSKDLSSRPKNLIVCVFGMILTRQAPPTAKGMVFFTLEDESGFLNLVLSPLIFRQYESILHRHGFLCVQAQWQGQSLLVRKVFDLKKEIAEVVSLKRTSPHVLELNQSIRQYL